MSSVYLVRHGQAGTRDSYDSLSELGRRQSRLLGEYFASQGIRFAAAYSGALQRQEQTAAEISTAFVEAAAPFPEIIIDSRWNEFDLTHVYRELGPLLAVEDAEFRREYDEMRNQVRQSRGDHAAPVHRRWRACDTRIVETWIAGRFPYSGETWPQFCDRVASGSASLPSRFDQQQTNVLVITSATPTAILTGLSLDISHDKVRQLAGVLHNASYTVLRQRGEHLRLFQFNAVPHLADAELRTHR